MATAFKLPYDPGFLYRQFQAENIDTPCIDIDQILLGRDWEPVALIETTSCDPGGPSNPNFLAACDARMNKSPQRRLSLRIARMLSVHAWWVVFTPPDFDEFALRRLDGSVWHLTDRAGYIAWVHKLAGLTKEA